MPHRLLKFALSKRHPEPRMFRDRRSQSFPADRGHADVGDRRQGFGRARESEGAKTGEIAPEVKGQDLARAIAKQEAAAEQIETSSIRKI